ncbi:LamG domain-containing protein [Streptomyces sp. 2P-4]|uniref:LamG domain-containing protein n=1 Tax=Streptomyces sp. 2P-4 TaxID=2931974 RepID=UPI002540BED2|nr:LamG domain-containing protein [Streptomyces sp. 2P-4]
MTDGKHPPNTPQPEPAPGNSGYGFPPVPPAPGGGYGFPPGQPAAGGGFGPPPGGAAPQGGYGFPQAGAPNPYRQDGTGAPAGAGAPGAPGAPGGPFQQNPTMPPAQWPPAGLPVHEAPAPAPFYAQQSGQPDWEALADRTASERRKKRTWGIVGGATVLALLAGGGAFWLLGGDGGEQPQADGRPAASEPGSPSPSGSKSKKPVDNSPTVKDDPTQIRDRAGKAPLKMGPDAGVFPIDKRFEIRTRGGENSYAESEKQIVDTSKSFTVSARVWVRSTKGRQIAVSQGNEKSSSFALGLDQVKGKPAWVFRVQTGDQGADATTVVVSGKSSKMEKTFAELTATYDAERKQIALYVNGKKAGEAAVPGIHDAKGPLQLARVRHEDKWTAAWNGAMDSIQTYDKALSAAQVDTLKPGKANASVEPTGAWLLY